QADAVLPLAAALLAHNEGRGHTCLPLDELLAPASALADPWLAGPLAAQADLAATLQRLPARTLADWQAALRASGAVDAAPQPGQPSEADAAPLLLDGARLYLRRHFRDELAVATALRRRVSIPVDGDADPRPDPLWVRGWLDRLFGALPPDRVDHQRIACATALRGRLTLITGGPGTGKTYTVARLLALVQADHERRQASAPGATVAPRPLRMALAAPTGKAAARLQQSIRSALDGLRAPLADALDWQTLIDGTATAQTLHALLGARPDTRQFARHAQRPLEVDLLVVDEASMVHLEMMAALLRALPDGARLVLLGDQDQLASVEAGAVLGDLCADAVDVPLPAADADWLAACTGQPLGQPFGPDAPLPAGRSASVLAPQMVQLRHSHRFAGAIGALARSVNAGEVAEARACLGWTQVGAWTDRVQRGPAVAALAGVDPALAVQVALGGRPSVAGAGDAAADPAASAASAGYRQMLQALARLRPDAAELAGLPAEARARQMQDWAGAVLACFDRSRVLCAVREGDWGVEGLNRAIEAALRRDGLIARQGEWYEGRPVMVTRNDPSLGVYNGDIGLALHQPPSRTRGGAPGPGGSADEPEPLRVWFQDGEQVRSVLASRLSAVETAWAMTVHKSQGSEFGHTVLVLPPRLNPVLSRELVYTGITRARLAFTLIAPEPSVFDAALQRRTRRASGLRGRLAG
ncbi:MAG: hypothetical protein RLZZ524_2695, partial [Pseudomonadota bacterium]